MVILFSKLSKACRKSKHHMNSWFFLYIIVHESHVIIKFFSCKDKPLLLRRDSFSILNLIFHWWNFVKSIHIQGNNLASQRFYEYLHFLLWLNFWFIFRDWWSNCLILSRRYNHLALELSSHSFLVYCCIRILLRILVFLDCWFWG